MIVPPIAVWKYSTLPELFTQYFLTEGIQDTDEWQACIHQSEAFEAFTDGVRQSYGSLGHAQAPYEARTTGKAIIRRMVLKRLLGGGVSTRRRTTSTGSASAGLSGLSTKAVGSRCTRD